MRDHGPVMEKIILSATEICKRQDDEKKNKVFNHLLKYKGSSTPATKYINNKIDNIGRNNVCVANDTMVSICWYGA
ncbi:hypothetical protein SK128_015789, partial [Halocaridina rubra]